MAPGAWRADSAPARPRVGAEQARAVVEDAPAATSSSCTRCLQGDTVDIDGERCQMIHHAEWAQARPLTTPLLLSAFGPKGKQVVADLYAEGVLDGYIGMADSTSTCLEGGDDRGHRARRRRGPVEPASPTRSDRGTSCATTASGRRSRRAGGLPGGDEWRAAVEAERPEGERHLAVHEGHVTNVMGRDAKVLSLAGETLGTTGWVGTPEEIRARAAIEAAGRRDLFHPDRRRRTRAAHVRRGGRGYNSTSSSSSSSGSWSAAATHSRIVGRAMIARIRGAGSSSSTS